MFEHDCLDTIAVLGISYACGFFFFVLFFFFDVCTCSAQLSMFHMERHSRKTIITIIVTLTMMITVIIIHIPFSVCHGGQR